MDFSNWLVDNFFYWVYKAGIFRFCTCGINTNIFSNAFSIFCWHIQIKLCKWCGWRISYCRTWIYANRTFWCVILAITIHRRFESGLELYLSLFNRWCYLKPDFFEGYLFKDYKIFERNCKIFDLCSNFVNWFYCYCFLFTFKYYKFKLILNFTYFWISF